MRQINTAICDDVKEIRAELKEMLRQSFEENGITYGKINTMQSGEELCSELQKADYDIVFLDIELTGVNGVETADYIREELKNDNIQIVFISAYSNYSINLHEYRPFNFLIKPLDYEMVNRVIKKYKSLYIHENKIFTYKKGHEFFHVPLSKVMYIEGNGRRVTVTTGGCTDTFYATMSDIYTDIGNKKFLYIHKSIIINYDYIRKMEYDSVIMEDGKTFSISQSRRKKIREEYMTMRIEEME